MSEPEPAARNTHKIPEMGPNFGDWFAANVIPQIFKFTEYCIVSGFVLFVGLKKDDVILKGLGYFLLGLVLFLTSQYMVDLVRALEFRKRWTMWTSAVLLQFVGFTFFVLTYVVVYTMATTQAGL